MQELARLADEAREANARAARAEAAAARLKKRASAGLCPCCNRSVGALERHMRTKHPQWVAEQRGLKVVS